MQMAQSSRKLKGWLKLQMKDIKRNYNFVEGLSCDFLYLR